jgi:hypothetical protein
MSPRAQTDASRLRNLREPSDALHAPGGYFTLSTKPLYALLFVLPLVVFYEIGVSRWLGPSLDAASAGGGGGDIRARRQLIDFFELAGVNGSIAAGALLITVLLLMHVFSGDRWSIKPRVLAGMVLESAILTMPMIVLGHLLASMLGVNGSASMLVEGATAATQASPVMPSPVMRSATIAVGAGLYEELLFRLIGIAIVHLILVDLAGIKDRAGQLLAVLLTAILFAFYHESGYLSDADPGTIVYYTVLGVCFGGIYLTRGFGIAVGVHVLFDAVILILLS